MSKTSGELYIWKIGTIKLAIAFFSAHIFGTKLSSIKLISPDSLHQLKIGRGPNDLKFVVSLHVPLKLSAVVIHKRELKFVLILNRDHTIH